jgi:arginase family enzyme
MTEEFQLYIMRHDRPSNVLAEKLQDLEPEVIDLFRFGGLLEFKKFSDISRKRVRRMIGRAFKGKTLEKTPIVVYGSGHYHHYTYGLCHELADKRSQRYTYIHIDQHTDFGSTMPHIYSNLLSCGNFVTQILEDSNAKPSIHIGQPYPYDVWVDLKPRISELKFITNVNVNSNTKRFKRVNNLFSWMRPEVYVTIDLDVLNSGVNTDYGNGYLTLNQLLKTLTQIKQRRKIIGLDICGLTEDEEIDERSIQTHRDIINCVRA